MRLNQKNSQVISNNKNASSVGFRIGDAPVVIDILRNRLYKNPIQTLVQEYLSNARDAHREAGVEGRQIEVTLPTRSNPVFRVKDFGPGLSPERIANVFVLYGVSTKRGSDNQTGGFGIGAKSAWAYSDHFTVSSVHNGKKTVYVAHIGRSSEGELETVGSEASSEESGVEIQIPVRPSDREAFFQAVLRATFFWTVRPKLMGVTKDRIPQSYQTPAPLIAGTFWQLFAPGSVGEIDETEGDDYADDDHDKAYGGDKDEEAPLFSHFLERKGTGSFGITAVVDGIPYRINNFKATQGINSLASMIGDGAMAVLFFSTGEVEVSADREGLTQGAQVNQLIDKRCRDAAKAIGVEANRFLQEKISESLQDGLQLYTKVMRHAVRASESTPLLLKSHGVTFDVNAGDSYRSRQDHGWLNVLGCSASVVHFTNDWRNYSRRKILTKIPENGVLSLPLKTVMEQWLLAVNEPKHFGSTVCTGSIRDKFNTFRKGKENELVAVVVPSEADAGKLLPFLEALGAATSSQYSVAKKATLAGERSPKVSVPFGSVQAYLYEPTALWHNLRSSSLGRDIRANIEKVVVREASLTAKKVLVAPCSSGHVQELEGLTRDHVLYASLILTLQGYKIYAVGQDAYQKAIAKSPEADFYAAVAALRSGEGFSPEELQVIQRKLIGSNHYSFIYNENTTLINPTLIKDPMLQEVLAVTKASLPQTSRGARARLGREDVYFNGKKVKFHLAVALSCPFALENFLDQHFASSLKKAASLLQQKAKLCDKRYHLLDGGFCKEAVSQIILYVNAVYAAEGPSWNGALDRSSKKALLETVASKPRPQKSAGAKDGLKKKSPRKTQLPGRQKAVSRSIKEVA